MFELNTPEALDNVWTTCPWLHSTVQRLRLHPRPPVASPTPQPLRHRTTLINSLNFSQLKTRRKNECVQFKFQTVQAVVLLQMSSGKAFHAYDLHSRSLHTLFPFPFLWSVKNLPIVLALHSFFPFLSYPLILSSILLSNPILKISPFCKRYRWISAMFNHKSVVLVTSVYRVAQKK